MVILSTVMIRNKGVHGVVLEDTLMFAYINVCIHWEV